MPRFYSTNRDLPGGFKEMVSFRQALFMGQAPDEGLFMPASIPRLDLDALRALKGRPYAETAFLLLDAFLHDEIDAKSLRAICDDAYDFPVPLEAVTEGRWLMRLDRGPTASFKDFAARPLARLMQKLKSPGETLTVLVATSGDTGSAAGEAFKGQAGISVFILYPKGEVSPTQKAQLDGIGGNVRSLAVDGKFDDCQDLVKRAFSDRALADLRLTSANSINFGRILPQMAYYLYAWTELANGEEIVFSVPSGNFGDALGCEFARRMGLPVRKLVLATNANDEFPRFLKTGRYEKVSPSRNCLSNAMNVGHPSNLARFFDLYGGTVDKSGIIRRQPDLEEMRARLCSVSIDDATTVATMKDVYQKYRVVLEPHGAVGWAGLEACVSGGDGEAPAVVLETADPAKFPASVRDALGFEPEPPDSLKRFKTPSSAYADLPNDYEAIKALILKASGI